MSMLKTGIKDFLYARFRIKNKWPAYLKALKPVTSCPVINR